MPAGRCIYTKDKLLELTQRSCKKVMSLSRSNFPLYSCMNISPGTGRQLLSVSPRFQEKLTYIYFFFGFTFYQGTRDKLPCFYFTTRPKCLLCTLPARSRNVLTLNVARRPGDLSGSGQQYRHHR